MTKYAEGLDTVLRAQCNVALCQAHTTHTHTSVNPQELCRSHVVIAVDGPDPDAKVAKCRAQQLDLFTRDVLPAAQDS